MSATKDEKSKGNDVTQKQKENNPEGRRPEQTDPNRNWGDDPMKQKPREEMGQQEKNK